MRNPSVPLIFVVSLAALQSLTTAAQGADQMQEASSPKPQTTEATKPQLAEETHPQERKSVRQPVYQPPRRGAPLVRVGGGTRGEGDTEPAVYVLAPEHTGLTTTTQPVLFWYSSGPSAARLEFALIDERSIAPVLETSLEPTRSAGIHRIALSAYGIELSPGMEYQWSVALIPDLEQRSRDLVATGRIEHVPLVPALASEIKNASPEDLPSLYAREGLWYDALAALSALIDARPKDSQLWEFRAALIEQVGLQDVAAAEREQTR